MAYGCPFTSGAGFETYCGDGLDADPVGFDEAPVGFDIDPDGFDAGPGLSVVDDRLAHALARSAKPTQTTVVRVRWVLIGSLLSHDRSIPRLPRDR